MTCHAVALPENSGVATSYRTVAVIGPPNSGKTTLYNRLTGLRQKVGNFPGVTVEHHIGYIKNRDGEDVALVDLPGIYSLTPKSEDERVAVDVLHGRMPGMARPDAVIVVLNVEQPAHPPRVGWTRDRPRTADACAAQHGRRTAQAERRG